MLNFFVKLKGVGFLKGTDTGHEHFDQHFLFELNTNKNGLKSCKTFVLPDDLSVDQKQQSV